MSRTNKCSGSLPGFAHGFLVISESADFLYKTTDFYSPADERTIRWNDPELAIKWPIQGIPWCQRRMPPVFFFETPKPSRSSFNTLIDS